MSRQGVHSGVMARRWAWVQAGGVVAIGLAWGWVGWCGEESGEAIYLRQCASCHGPDGEGVVEWYEQPLRGSWSLERLTRIIVDRMPEGEPELCVGSEAVAVAGYVHERFSRSKGERESGRPRVELMRLTNRQYMNTVADLVRTSVGSDGPRGEAGLLGSYYGSRGFGRGDLVFSRVDPQVAFDFDTESPDPDRMASDVFAVRWRGSVIAVDTGDHEFVVRSPNGFRLWVNDVEEPLIDAWVASGDREEHRASRRLIGGRNYPLRLDFFKSKDWKASVSLEWRPPHGVTERVPARRLLTGEAKPTLVVETVFPPDDASVGYERGVGISKAWDDATTLAALEVANRVVRDLDSLAGTEPGSRDRAARIEVFARKLVISAFRRPLAEDLADRFVGVHLREAETLEEGVKRVVLLALKSPRFLYPGLGGDGADGYQVATRLAYGLWDSMPDGELIEQAGRGRLETVDQVRRQAIRMLEDSRARSKVRSFLHHWLQLDRVESVAKDPTLFPGFNDAVIADLRTSLDLFLEAVVWGEGSDYRQLLTAETLYLNRRLAEFYGWEPPSDGGFGPVRLEEGERAGVLTHPYLLAAFAYPRSSSPIHRGVFLTRKIIGRPLNAPPVAVAFEDSAFDPHLTMREKVSELTRPESCQSCHATINPLGFSLEHFDAVGRYRVREGERVIDATGDFLTGVGETVRLTGARDVARMAVESDQARAAFVEQVFHAVVKQPVLAYGPEVLDQLARGFAESGFNIRWLLAEIATTAALYGIEDAAPMAPAALMSERGDHVP